MACARAYFCRPRGLEAFMKDISYESWQSEIQKAMFKAGDEGMTAREISDILRLSVKTTLNRIKELHTSNKIIVGRRRVRSIDGREAWVPVYRLKGKR